MRLTYSTSSRHGGQAKAGSDAPLALTVFASGASHSDTTTTMTESMHRKRLTIGGSTVRDRRYPPSSQKHETTSWQAANRSVMHRNLLRPALAGLRRVRTGLYDAR